MQPLYYFMIPLLVSFSLLPSGSSIQCNDTQYAWPPETPKSCCNKCQPGHHMASQRTSTSCDIKCKPCMGDRFMDSHNVELTCNICDSCDKPNFVTESNCTSTRNTVCKCKTGYRCTDKVCKMCEPIPSTPTPTPSTPPAVLEPNNSWPPSKPMKDTVWFLVIIALLCAGIALVVLTKIKPFLHWIRSNHGYFLAEKPSTEPSSTEDEDVSKPVQEVCGKCDQPIEICVKE